LATFHVLATHYRAALHMPALNIPSPFLRVVEDADEVAKSGICVRLNNPADTRSTNNIATISIPCLIDINSGKSEAGTVCSSKLFEKSDCMIEIRLRCLGSSVFFIYKNRTWDMRDAEAVPDRTWDI